MADVLCQLQAEDPADIGLSESDLSEEEGEGMGAYRGESQTFSEDVSALGRAVREETVESSSSHRRNDSEEDDFGGLQMVRSSRKRLQLSVVELDKYGARNR